MISRMATTETVRDDPIRLRDAALRRISLTRRWMILAAAGLTAGLAGLVSTLLPGKSLGAKSPVATASARPAATSATATPPLPAPASADQLGVGAAGQSPQSLPPPTVAPQPAAPAQSAPAAAPVVSGGS
jgi:hypothetical protein